MELKKFAETAIALSMCFTLSSKYIGSHFITLLKNEDGLDTCLMSSELRFLR